MREWEKFMGSTQWTYKNDLVRIEVAIHGKWFEVAILVKHAALNWATTCKRPGPKSRTLTHKHIFGTIFWW